MPSADACLKHGPSPVTFCKLRIKYGGLEIAEARWLNALEDKTPS